MTMNMLQSGPASERTVKPADAFSNRGLTEGPRRAEDILIRLRETLQGCTSGREGFDLGAFALGIKSAEPTNIAGGAAMTLKSEDGSFLLYREAFDGHHLIVSGLVGVKPQDAIPIRTKKSDMYLVQLPS